jgi:hypothetical protein
MILELECTEPPVKSHLRQLHDEPSENLVLHEVRARVPVHLRISLIPLNPPQGKPMPEMPEIAKECPLVGETGGIAEATPSAQSESPETAHVSENLKEHEPMLDVHIPHATHTWKDFWIHLGTITAGLLIAISLEQSVEKLHNLYQRHELQAALRAEGEGNKNRAEADLALYDAQMAWLLGLHKDIGRMMATGGKANLPYRTRQDRLDQEGRPISSDLAFIDTVVWDTASADSRLALLPDEEAQGYSRLYHIVGERFREYQRLDVQAGERRRAFEAQFADISDPKTPVMATMSAADLMQYDALVMQNFESSLLAKSQLRDFYGVNEAHRQGLWDDTLVYRALRDAKTRFADDYGKMAKEIEAEDAARDKAAAKPTGKWAR